MFRRILLAISTFAIIGAAGLAIPDAANAWDGWYDPYYYGYGYRRGYDYAGAPYYPGYGPPYYPGYGPPYTAGISPHYPYPRFVPVYPYPEYRPAYLDGPIYR